MEKITIKFYKSNKNTGAKAQLKLSATGFGLHQMFSAKLEAIDNMYLLMTFDSIEQFAYMFNISVPVAKEAINNLVESGYMTQQPIIGCENSICLHFYQNGTVSAKDSWLDIMAMMDDNYYVVREWINRKVF